MQSHWVKKLQNWLAKIETLRLRSRPCMITLKFSNAFKDKLLTIFSMVCIVSVGVFLRFYNLNWDNYSIFHPDERNIANAVTQIHFFTNLNPHFFAYGGFSIYLYRAAIDILVWITHDTQWAMDWGHINIVGRFFSAFFSILTIFPLYFLAKKLFNSLTAILSVSFFVFCVSSIQMAHFAVTESLLTCEGILLALLALWIFEKPTISKILITGIVFGIALATKTSALSLGIMPFLGVLFALWKRRVKTYHAPLLFLLFCIVSGTFFFLFSPYTILDSKHFLESMQYESGVATGSLPVVYTLQFNHTIAYVFQLTNMVWQIGPLIPFASIGFLLYLFVGLKTKRFSLLIFLAFPLIYFAYVGSWHTKFIRYMMPIIPFLLIIGSGLLISLREKKLLAGNILITILVLTTNLWAVAFFSIYTRPQTRIAGSYWIYNHIPYGSKILTEQWDDGLPVGLGSYSPSLYASEGMAIYDADNAQKRLYYATTLASADYIVLNSRRLYGTLIHLKDQYPLTSIYYTYLFAGKLGYKEVATFASYPSLFGLTINDDASEETFQVYDHPKVRIFQNIKHFSAEQLLHIL